jgi:hypothetical protein
MSYKHYSGNKIIVFKEESGYHRARLSYLDYLEHLPNGKLPISFVDMFSSLNNIGLDLRDEYGVEKIEESDLKEKEGSIESIVKKSKFYDGSYSYKTTCDFSDWKSEYNFDSSSTSYFSPTLCMDHTGIHTESNDPPASTWFYKNIYPISEDYIKSINSGWVKMEGTLCTNESPEEIEKRLKKEEEERKEREERNKFNRFDIMEIGEEPEESGE